MARYLKRQDEVKCFIDEEGDLVIQHNVMDEIHYVFINENNIQSFLAILKASIDDGYQGKNDGLV